MEHYRCASVDSHLKSTYQDGSQLYLCTLCLAKDPTLGLKLIQESTPAITMAEDIGKGKVAESDNGDNHQELVYTVQAMIEEISSDTSKETQDKQFECDVCKLITVSEKQLETHMRIKHIDIRSFNCVKCTFGTNGEDKLN